MSNFSRLGRLRAFLLDLDGVVYRGEQTMPGARQFFDYLHAEGLRYCLITNNSTMTEEEVAGKLTRLGITASIDDIVTSSGATAHYLAASAQPGGRVLVIGGHGLRQAVRSAGFIVTSRRPDYVVVGMDVKLTYTKLARATTAIRQGAKFIASNSDPTLPTERGELPGAGAIVAALRATTNVAPIVVGKPQPLMLQMALQRLQAAPPETASVGDRLETDVVAGQRLGLCTILVLTGVTNSEQLGSGQPGPAQMGDESVRPDFVFEDVGALLGSLVAARSTLERAED